MFEVQRMEYLRNQINLKNLASRMNFLSPILIIANMP
jgi:hypothetical protein